MGQPKRKNASHEEEDQLAKKLFGDKAGFPEGYDDSDNDDNEEEEEGILLEAEASRAPAWHDEDDEIDEAVVDVPLHHRKLYLRKFTDAKNQKITPGEYGERLREAFRHGSGAVPDWAQPTKVSHRKGVQSSDSDDDDLEDALHEMTASTGKYVARSTLLPKGVINVKRLGTITRGHRFGKKPVRALQFHPTRQVLMCAGENGLVSLFEVGLPETEEAFLQDVRFKAFPVTSAAFTADGSRIIVGSVKKECLFCYDLLDGKVTQMRTPYEMAKMNAGSFWLSPDGRYMAVLARNEVHILTATSMEYIGVLTAPTRIACMQFHPSDSSTIYASGENGQIFIWNIRKPREQHTFDDEGAVKGTVIRISKNGQYLACGSNTGIVNLYDSADVVMNNPFPKPIKIFDNLTTSVDCMAFSNDSQILSISSNVKANAFRLLHVGSRTVYANFPPRNVGLGNVTVTDFSPKSAYMAVGDDQGFLSLFRLLHFNSY